MSNKFLASESGFVFHKNNEILALITQKIQAIIDSLGLSEEWQVAQANQPTIQALQDKTIYFDIISKRRLGVQSDASRQDLATGQWFEAWTWLEDWIVQVSAFKKRNPETDTKDTWTGIDMITHLQACINNNGVPQSGSGKLFNEDWINVVRSTDLREIDYETDSGLKEKYPQFDFTLVVEQALLKTIPNIDKIELETERI